MAVSEALQAAITEVVNAQFSDAQISSVKVQSGEDSDGDPVLKIFVVFETKNESDALDGKKMAALARHIIDHLSSIEPKDLEAFPLVSFVSKRDLAKLNLETA